MLRVVTTTASQTLIYWPFPSYLQGSACVVQCGRDIDNGATVVLNGRREGGKEGGREQEREGGREGGRERERERAQHLGA